jgi:ribosomal protein S18 acetylase RimI-like enzyme
VRPYEPDDETAWTRCRALAFLDTAYFDDVLQAKSVYAGGCLEFVTVEDADVAGLVDVTFDETRATIETIAVHPDRQGRGLATAMFEEVLEYLPRTISAVDAWTRDDATANGWYQSRGFVESYRYLHVYANETEITHAGVSTDAALTPVAGFFHASIEAEAQMRDLFSRVHVCRQYVLSTSALHERVLAGRE